MSGHKDSGSATDRDQFEPNVILPSFFRDAPVAVAMFDTDMRLILCSRRWQEEFGLQAQPCTGRSIYELIPDLPDAWRNAHERCLSGTTEHAERDRFVRADGKQMLMRWTMKPWHRDRERIGGLTMSCEKLGSGESARSLLSVANRMFRTLYNQMPVMLFSLDRRGLISDVNRYWLDRMGYDFADVVGSPLINFLSDSSRHYLERVCLPTFLKTGMIKDEPIEFRHSNGELVEVLLSASANRDSSGYTVDSVVVATDITDLRRTEDRLRQVGSALQVLNKPVVLADKTGRITEVNPAFLDLTEFAEAEVVGSPLFSLCDKACLPGDSGSIREALDQQGNWQGELYLTKRNGESIEAHVRLEEVRTDSDEISHLVMICDEKHEEESSGKGQDESLHDQLTKLPNRHLLEALINDALISAEQSDTCVAVCYLDLDRFKTINESLGHEVGDRILEATARRLTGIVRADDVVARIGGDDFVVVLRHIRDQGSIMRFQEKMLTTLSSPLRLAEYEVCFTGSVGISVFPDNGASSDALLRNADAALHRAKEGGGNRYHFYTPELTTKAHKRLSLDTALRKALRNEEFVLLYQPQVSVDNRIVDGVEALLRWQHPKMGLLSPSRFLEYAEEIGLIVSIGEWVIQEACRQAHFWDMAGFPEIRTAVNVSARQLIEDEFVQQVRSAIDQAGIRPDMLELEITESIFLKHNENLIRKLRDLKSLGVTLTIDDFGAGYSSLAYLKNLPVDRLKIDKGFIKDLPEDPNDAAIASAIVSLSESLALGVVAEGVETEAQFNCLKSMGCGHTQGFLFGGPMAADKVSRKFA